MSMPSSSALVETTTLTLPARRPCSISRRRVGQVAAAVAADLVGMQAERARRLLQVARQHLDRRAALAEEDRLVVRARRACARELARFLERVRAQARDRVQAAAGCRRRRCAAPEGEASSSIDAHRPADKLRDVRRGLAQRRRAAAGTAGCCRSAARCARDAARRSRRSSRRRPRACALRRSRRRRRSRKSSRPLGVVGKDPGVQHPGIREHEVPAIAQRAAHRGRRVAVVGEGVPVFPQRLDLARQHRRSGPGSSAFVGKEEQRSRAPPASRAARCNTGSV